MIQHSNLVAKPHSFQRALTTSPLACGRHALIDQGGLPVCYATVTLYWSSPYVYDMEDEFAQFNPSKFSSIAEMYDTRPRLASMSHFLAFSDRLPVGEYRLIPAPFRDQHTPITLYIGEANSEFGIVTPLKLTPKSK